MPQIQDALKADKFWDMVDPCMGPYPRKGVEALLELALACVEADQDNRPQMIDVARDLETIMRDTVALDHSPSSQSWSKGAGDSSQGSSFNKVSESWAPKKTTFSASDLSWASTDDQLINNRSKVNVEMEPR